MYSLIIIDDEIEIRDGLSKFFDWNALGFSVQHTFDSPIEALHYL